MTVIGKVVIIQKVDEKVTRKVYNLPAADSRILAGISAEMMESARIVQIV